MSNEVNPVTGDSIFENVIIRRNSHLGLKEVERCHHDSENRGKEQDMMTGAEVRAMWVHKTKNVGSLYNLKRQGKKFPSRTSRRNQVTSGF